MYTIFIETPKPKKLSLAEVGLTENYYHRITATVNKNRFYIDLKTSENPDDFINQITEMFEMINIPVKIMKLTANTA